MSPVRSLAQARFLAIHRPDLLRKWQREAPRDLAALPEHVAAKSKGTPRKLPAPGPRRTPQGLVPRSKR